MPKYQRQLWLEVAESAILEVVKVGPANAHRSNLNLDLAWTRILYAAFGDSEPPVGVILCNTHAHFLKRLSKAVRASLGVRITGAGIFAPGCSGPVAGTAGSIA
jgi:hypothetical protein